MEEQGIVFTGKSHRYDYRGPVLGDADMANQRLVEDSIYCVSVV
jgi:hypothetical protein